MTGLRLMMLRLTNILFNWLKQKLGEKDITQPDKDQSILTQIKNTEVKPDFVSSIEADLKVEVQKTEVGVEKYITKELPKIMSFLSVLSAIGKFFEKGLNWALTYAIPIETLVKLLFPTLAAPTQAAFDAASLIQAAVISVEQKYAASGAQNGTGTQKLAEVLTLAQGAVTTLLKDEGITVDTAYMTQLVNAVVALLNVQNGSGISSTTTGTNADYFYCYFRSSCCYCDSSYSCCCAYCINKNIN